MKIVLFRQAEKGFIIQITIIPPEERIINNDGRVVFARMPACLPEDVP